MPGLPPRSHAGGRDGFVAPGHGYRKYESPTGRNPTLHEYDVREVLAKEAIHLLDFNPDG